jgi:NAD(P)-dependent dehydrogenase (short-subunit alcohol dehydrogenase family)
MGPAAKIVVITGAGSGIGRATARIPRRRVFRWYSPDAAAPDACGADVTDPAAIAALFDTVKATHGRIDLLFNNAGISIHNIPIEDLTREQWSSVVAVNLTGSFLCAQHAFRMMKSQQPRGGRIIKNGSVSAHVPRRNSTPYAAT